MAGDGLGSEGEARLWCPGCGTSQPVDGPPEPVRYRCGTCDAVVPDPRAPDPGPDAEERTLYPTRLVGVPPWTLGVPTTPALGSSPPVRRFGRFVLLDEIGRGGMGVVYRAYDAERSRLVALKVLLAGEHSSPEHVERFLREASAAARLDHGNLIPVLDTGWADQRAYFTMPLVEGPSLDEVIAQAAAAGRPIRTAEAVRIVRAIAGALEAAHEAGLVHRDVKPSNILLGRNGVPRLGDFGLVAERDGAARLTRTGQLLGTPAYMAPEQLLANAPPSPATDQYALGAVLYEMLAGVPAYAGADAMSVIRKVMEGPPPPIRAARPDVPGPVGVVLDKAMARDPRDRYADLGALADDLGRVARGAPTVARPPGPIARAVRWARRHQRAVSGLAVVALTAVIATQAALVVREIVVHRVMADRERGAQAEATRVEREVAELRADGRLLDAAASLDTFAEAPAHRGTTAASRALIARASLLSEAESPEATSAWASAYAAAREATAQDPALRGLAAHFARSWRWEPLASVVDILVERSPSVAADPTVARWRIQALVGAGRLREAAALATDHALPDAPLLSSFVGARRARDLDGRVSSGGPGWRLAWAPGSAHLRASGDGGARWEAMLPSPARELHAVSAPAPMVLVRDTAGIATLYAAEGALSPLVAFPSGPLMAAAAADVDGDGAIELWVGVGPYARELVRLDPAEPGGWRVSRPATRVDATRSDITGVVAADLDGDGRTELVVSAGAWRAYDVRALGFDRSAHGTLLARIKLGATHGLIVDPADPRAVWVAKENRLPSRLVFAPDTPFGRAPGVYRLKRRGAQLEVDRFVPSPLGPSGPSSVGAPLLADLDGDDVDDLVFTVSDDGRAGLVVVPGADPTRAPWILPHFSASAVVQADDDPADELVVHEADGTAWIAGAGAEALPAAGGARILAEAVPEGVRPANVERRWGRAEELVAMGLYDAAIDELERIADVATGATAVGARARAGTLAEAMGDDLRAATLFGAVGDGPALQRAGDAHLRGHRFAEARHAFGLAERRGATVPSLAALEASVASTRAVHLDLRDPSTALGTDPLMVAPTDAGLRVSVASDAATPILSLPFRWSGDRLGLQVDLDLRRLEWASGVQIALIGADGDRIGLQVAGWGGGERLEEEVGCVTSFGAGWSRRRGRDSPAEPRSLTLAIDVSATTGDLRCTLGPGVGDHTNVPLDRLPSGGPWRLVVTATGHAGHDAPALAEAVLRSITLTGSNLVTAPSGPLARPDDPIAQAVALAHAGRSDEAELRLASVGAEAEGRLADVLRVHPATLGPPLRAAFGADRYYALFERAFSVVMAAHPDDAALGVALTASLPDLEPSTRSSDPAVRDRATRLLAARGRAWAALGQAAAARRDLREALRLGAGLDGGRDDPPDGRASVWLDLAALEAGEGDEHAALAAVTQAIAASSAPEITADRVRAVPRLARYADQPAWALVLDAPR